MANTLAYACTVSEKGFFYVSIPYEYKPEFLNLVSFSA